MFTIMVQYNGPISQDHYNPSIMNMVLLNRASALDLTGGCDGLSIFFCILSDSIQNKSTIHKQIIFCYLAVASTGIL